MNEVESRRGATQTTDPDRFILSGCREKKKKSPLQSTHSPSYPTEDSFISFPLIKKVTISQAYKCLVSQTNFHQETLLEQLHYADTLTISLLECEEEVQGRKERLRNQLNYYTPGTFA